MWQAAFHITSPQRQPGESVKHPIMFLDGLTLCNPEGWSNATIMKPFFMKYLMHFLWCCSNEKCISQERYGNLIDSITLSNYLWKWNCNLFWWKLSGVLFDWQFCHKSIIWFFCHKSQHLLWKFIHSVETVAQLSFINLHWILECCEYVLFLHKPSSYKKYLTITILQTIKSIKVEPQVILLIVKVNDIFKDELYA